MSSHPSNQVLPFTAPRQSLTDYLDQLAQLEPYLVEQLETLDESVILDTRSQAKQLEKYGWRIQCACDAAIWKQTAAAKRGRGNKDIDAVGILAAVSKKSKQIGVTPTTIYRNAQIFRLMEEAKNVIREHNVLDVLEEKGYYDVALSAADPIKALSLFAEKKLTLPRFRVTDAGRLLKAEGQTRQAVALKAVEQIREESGQLEGRSALIAHIATATDIIKNQIIPNCPDSEFKERFWDDLLLSLQDEHQELFDQDASDALIKAWDEGHHREDQMSAALGLPLPDVSRLMDSMVGQFIQIQPRDIKERSEFRLWHKAGEPFDNAKYLPKGKL